MGAGFWDWAAGTQLGTELRTESSRWPWLLTPSPVLTSPCFRDHSRRVTPVNTRSSGLWRQESKKEYVRWLPFDMCVGQMETRRWSWARQAHTGHWVRMSQCLEGEGGDRRLLRLAVWLSPGAQHPAGSLLRQLVWRGESSVIRGALTSGRSLRSLRKPTPLMTQSSLPEAPMLVPHFWRFPYSSVHLNCPLRPLKERCCLGEGAGSGRL